MGKDPGKSPLSMDNDYFIAISAILIVFSPIIVNLSQFIYCSTSLIRGHLQCEQNGIQIAGRCRRDQMESWMRVL